MKVAILGANGKAGSLILNEAKERGFDVTAIVRDAKKITDDTPVIEKDVMSLTTEDIKDFDVLVSALGFWGDDVNQYSPTTEHLLTILEDQPTRLFIVGGAGSLFVDPEHKVELKDTPDFPESFKPLATAMSKALQILKNAQGVNWTFISPAAEFDAEGEKTGVYTFAGEEFTTNAEGKSYISYADFATALVDEIAAANYPNQRISVFH